MAAENKQLKNEFLGTNMTTTSRPYISSESKNFAASMLHQKADEVDNAKELTFKSSYSETNFKKTTTNGSETRFSSSESYTISSNGISKRVEITKENGEKLTSPMKSFIQQRVERLYGPGALAQGFFNQKRFKLKSQSEEDESKVLTEKSLNCPDGYSTPRKANKSFESENIKSSPNGESDSNLSLPVLRHLRPEFRAQLPILSPKKCIKSETSPQNDIPKVEKTEPEKEKSVVSVANGVSVINLDDSKEDVVVKDCQSSMSNGEVNGEVIKDGYYFLELKKKETARLIELSVAAEKELESLQDKNISEEVLGILRAASGKARLLATQKMQQFEGLCYNNINSCPDDQFPTTSEDLQGFWDMVCLQVANVDALHANLQVLKSNGWREVTPPVQPPSTSTPVRPRQRGTPAPKGEKARLAAEKRDAERKAMLEHRRRIAKERQMAARMAEEVASDETNTAVEGSQSVEIFIGRTAKPSKVAPTGDCMSGQGSQNSLDLS